MKISDNAIIELKNDKINEINENDKEGNIHANIEYETVPIVNKNNINHK